MIYKVVTSDNRWIILLTFLIAFVVFYVTALPLMDDSDVPWHLATGRLLWQTHHLPATDPWSFVNASGASPWYNLSWIWDILLGGAERALGAFGVFILVMVISAGMVAFIAARLLNLGVTLSAVFFTMILATLCLMDFVTARPQLAGYGFALIFHALLHASRGGRYGKLGWLPPLMLVWANTHGSFIAGFTILGAFLLEAFFAKNRPWLNRLIIISAACGMGALINPYGLDVWIGAMRTLGGHARTNTIEWLPFAFTISTGVSAWLMVFILASNARIRQVPLADKILAFSWLVATMFIMRNGAIFILLSAPYLALCLDEQTRGLRQARKPSVFLTFMERQPPSRVWIACIALLIMGVTAAEKLPHEDKILTEDFSASDAIDFALAHYPTHRYLTDFNFGGQVIYRTGGKLPMFMDSRAAVAYSEQAMLDYLDFLWLRPGWQAKLAAYGVNAIMVSNNVKFAKAYEEGQFHDAWKLVFAGKIANVYIAAP